MDTHPGKQFLSDWNASRSDVPDILLSLVIPAYNEQERLPPTLDSLLEFFGVDTEGYEVIVANDGSTDDTVQVVKSYQQKAAQIKLLSLTENQGKGAATKAGVLAAQGAFVLFEDADGSTPIGEIERLQQAINDGADIAIGSRALCSEETAVATSFHRKALGRLFNWLMNALLLPGIADTQCGFKLFTREAARFVFTKQQTTGFSFDLELLYIARAVNLKISEVPVNWTNVEGSKVNLIADAQKMFFDAFRIRSWHKTLSAQDYNDFFKK